jgi:hypothetical protein
MYEGITNKSNSSIIKTFFEHLLKAICRRVLGFKAVYRERYFNIFFGDKDGKMPTFSEVKIRG